MFLNMLAFLTAGGIVYGFYLLVLWVRFPILQARRLADRFDPIEEMTFVDPNDKNERSRVHQFSSLSCENGLITLSVIVPAYNEEARIVPMLTDTINYLDERKKKDGSFTYEIIVVDDCSTDKTVEIVMEQVKKHTVNKLKLLKLNQNHGKGGAIRKGVMRASGRSILFADADGATEIRDLQKLEEVLLSCLEGREGVIVCGSRAHLEEEAIAQRNPLRNLLMHGFHLIVSNLCVKDVRDTQCGFKLFDRTAAKIVFAPLHIERWAFDVELLFIAARRNLLVKEVAVRWTEIPGSKLDIISATLTMLRELVLIRFCYTFGIWKVTDGGFRLSARRSGAFRADD